MAAAKQYDLTFEGGKTKRVTVKPVHHLRAERALNGRTDAQGKPVPVGANESVFHWLWFAATGKPVLVVDEFNEWIEKLEDWEPVEKEAAADPPVPSPSGSPG